MKQRISKIMGVSLALAMLVSTLVAVTPASAGTLSLSRQRDEPSQPINLIAAGTDIASLAVRGDTVYAATGAAGAGTANATPLFKSTDGGVSWTNLISTTDFPPGKAVKLVAIAPDDANIVVIVTTDNEIHYSTTGGSKWANVTGTPSVFTTVNDVAVSPLAAGTRYFAAAGTSLATGIAELWTLKLDIAQGWQARSSFPGFGSGATALAAKFSPNFATDKIVLIVTDNTPLVKLQAFREESGAFTWNNSIAFFSADWGILLGAKVADNVTTVTAASIALPPDYRGNSIDTRTAFVGLSGTGTSTTFPGAFRISDTFSKELTTWNEGQEGSIVNLAYHDSGKLLAGRLGPFTTNDDAKVFVSLAPMASSPKFERVNSLKQPGGSDRAVVGWSGTKAVAGTSGDESAFAVSADNGVTFVDQSLIDTALTTFNSVASPDGKLYYLSTASADNDVSIWTNGPWRRVFSRRDVDLDSSIGGATPTHFTVLQAPDDGKTLYIAVHNSQAMWMTTDSGVANWTFVPAYRLGTIGIQDFVVLNKTTVYAISTSQASVTTTSGAAWNDAVGLDGVTGHNVIVAPNGDVIVGGSNGLIAFSKDKGVTFTKTSSPASGINIVAVDSAYATNNNIYTFVGSEVRRGKAVSTPQTFSNRGPTIDASFTYVGARSVGTVVYGVATSASTNVTKVWRALALATADNADLALWSGYQAGDAASGVIAGGVDSNALVMTSEPRAIIIRSANQLYDVYDPIATTAPKASAPANATVIQVNPVSGNTYDVTLTWARPFADSAITKMDIEIATDSAFTAIVDAAQRINITTNTVSAVIGPSSGGLLQVGLNPNTTYYWRTRVAVDGPAYSPWSAAQNFVTGQPVGFEILGPAVGASDVSLTPTFSWKQWQGAVGYELLVSKDPTFETIVWVGRRNIDTTFYKVEVPLEYNTTYYWEVRYVTGPRPAEDKPAPGGVFQKGVFTTMAEPAPPAPPAPPAVVVQPGPAQIIQVPVPQPAPIPPYLLWTIIAIGGILVIALIVLIVRTRRAG